MRNLNPQPDLIELASAPELPRLTTQPVNFNWLAPAPTTIAAIAPSRFKIQQTLPAIGELKCYLATNPAHHRRCDMCGWDNAPDSEFCSQCGFCLADTALLVLEGERQAGNGFELVVRNQLEHPGILQFYDVVYVGDKCDIIAQHTETTTLAELAATLPAVELLEWIIQLTEAVDFLHRQHIFRVNLAPDQVLLGNDGPLLVNFSNAIQIDTTDDQFILDDIRALAESILTLLPKTEPENQNMLALKNICINARTGIFNTIGAMLYELLQLKQIFLQLEPATRSTQTIAVSDRGACISVGKASDVGMVRSLNEDSLVAFELTNILQSVATPFGFYMVADGMGGHAAGEQASKIAVEHISQQILEAVTRSRKLSEAQARQILEHAVFSANNEIHKLARAKNNNMGSTATLALVIRNKAYILNVGDTRTYHLRNKKLTLLTQDHSLVFRLYKMGQIRYDEMMHHPQSNQILCALGEPNLRTSLENLAQQANQPYFFTISLKKGDSLLLCSDGLWQLVADTEIEQILNKQSHPQSIVNELVQKANRNGGDDNISVIFVQIQ